jgi:hypothetical protein
MLLIDYFLSLGQNILFQHFIYDIFDGKLNLVFHWTVDLAIAWPLELLFSEMEYVCFHTFLK